MDNIKNLKILKSTRDNIKTALIECGVEPVDNMMSYADDIRRIEELETTDPTEEKIIISEIVKNDNLSYNPSHISFQGSTITEFPDDIIIDELWEGTSISPYGMFSHCENLVTTPDLSNLINTDYYFDNDVFKSIFSYCKKLKNVDKSLIDLITFISSKSSDDMYYPFNGNSMFAYCESLTEFPPLDYSIFDYLSSAFKNTGIRDVDLEFKQNIVDAGSMFESCKKLETVRLSSTANEKVKIDSSFMFFGCTNLKTVNISSDDFSFDYMDYMFSNCTSLSTIPFTKRVSSNYTGLYDNCIGLKHLPVINLNSSDGFLNFAFRGCINVETIDGVENVYTNLNLTSFPKLTRYSIINLANTTTRPNKNETYIYLVDEQHKRLSDEDIAFITSKGWIVWVTSHYEPTYPLE